MDKAKDISLGIYEKAMPDFLSFKEKFILARESGFDHVEISIDETDKKLNRIYLPKQDIEKIALSAKEAGIPIKTMCLSGHRKYPLGSMDPDIRGKSLEILEKALEFSQIVGVRIIQLAGYDVYYEDSNEDTKKYFLENLINITEKAAKYGISMGFETMETEFMDNVSKAMAYVNKVDSPYLGVYPDIGNLKNACVKYGDDVVEEIKAGKGKIFAAHLKETTPGVYRNMDFGTGHTEYKEPIKELLEQGVRIFTGEFWYQGEQDYREKIRNAHGFLRGLFV